MISLLLSFACGFTLQPASRPLHSHAVARAAPPLAVDTGKFARHSDLSPGCAPLGILIAGFDDDQLEEIAGAVESIFADADGQVRHVPIAVLDQRDFGRGVLLKDVLAEL